MHFGTTNENEIIVNTAHEDEATKFRHDMFSDVSASI